MQDSPDGFISPIQRIGDIYVKRDDLFVRAGVHGGKVRTCWALARGATGLVTAGSRLSPQVNIVAHVARAIGVPCRVHVPSGPETSELKSAREVGAEIIKEIPGYNSVIVARAKRDAGERGWTLIPFGMECQEAVEQTAAQVRHLPSDVRRIVIPVGSGMSLAGVLKGLKDEQLKIPVLGVMVGADPRKRLSKYAPGYRNQCQLASSGMDYHAHAEVTNLGSLELDPIYEAKCIPFLKPGDLFWVVGIRGAESGHGP